MGNGASHWEATDQSRLVRSWEGATGKVGQCPSAVSRSRLRDLFSGEAGALELVWGFCEASSFLPPPG